MKDALHFRHVHSDDASHVERSHLFRTIESGSLLVHRCFVRPPNKIINLNDTREIILIANELEVLPRLQHRIVEEELSGIRAVKESRGKSQEQHRDLHEHIEITGNAPRVDIERPQVEASVRLEPKRTHHPDGFDEDLDKLKRRA